MKIRLSFCLFALLLFITGETFAASATPQKVVITPASFSEREGMLIVEQQMANHESARTTGLYDRRDDQVSLDEVERILI